MVTNFLYNLIIELIVFIAFLLWVIIGATILIPLLVYCTGEDYWNFKGIMEELRENKI